MHRKCEQPGTKKDAVNSLVVCLVQSSFSCFLLISESGIVSELLKKRFFKQVRVPYLWKPSVILSQNQPLLHASLKDKTVSPKALFYLEDYFLFMSSISFYPRGLLSVYLFTLLTHERLVPLREFED